MADGQHTADLTEVELSTGTVLEVKESVEELELRLRERWSSRDAALEFLTLTQRNGRKVKVNPAHVVAIASRAGTEPVGFHTPAAGSHSSR